MKHVAILFGTLTGNTQIVAEQITDKLKHIDSKLQISLYNVADIEPKQLMNLSTVDLLLMGSSTWDEGQYPYEMRKFLTDCQLAEIKIDCIRFACFGCGDSSYGEYFCQAVDKLNQTLTSWGGQQTAEGLKIDGFPEMSESQVLIDNWIKTVVQSMVGLSQASR